jgi:hypothetical protein
MPRDPIRTLLVAAVLLVGVTPHALAAQDAHYWTQQYGPRASLLGGAVIGSVDGFAATFYNPARLSLLEGPGFVLSTQVFEFESITVENGAGQGVDLSTTRSGLEPSLIAGRLPFGGDAHTWAYSLLTRQRVNTDVGTELIFDADEIDPEEGLERVVGTVRFENDVRDSWAGVSWAHRPGARIGLGATMFGALRSHSSRFEGIGQSLDSAGVGEADIDIGGHNYWSIRLLWKVGVYYQVSKLDLGLTLTTPSVQLLGQGRVGASRGRFGDDEGDALAADLQDGLDSSYRSPLSVGLGAAWTLGDTRLHGSAEWFAALDPYDVIAADAIPVEGDTVRVGLTHAANSVLNWGVGVEHRFSARVQGFASLVTDLSAAPDEPVAIGTAPWDITLGTVGADVTVGEVRFTLGAGLGSGNSPFDRVTDLLGVSQSEVLGHGRQDPPPELAIHLRLRAVRPGSVRRASGEMAT